MKALLIEWDGATGRRAGNIDMSDPKLQCYGWQNLVARPCLELRVIEDDRDVSQYEGIEGVTILDGDKAIDAAIDKHFPPKPGFSLNAIVCILFILGSSNQPSLTL